VTHVVSATVTGLVPHALYYVRLVATNAAGTTFSSDQTFTTSADPPPRAPTLGGSENAKPVSGTVFILVRGRLVPLTEARTLPVGTIVDARRGSLELIAAGPHRRRQTGVFGGAIFKLTQSHAGLTTLALVEGVIPGAPSYASCTVHRAADAQVAAVSSRVLQLLHASAHGRFRTRGRYAAATVRGTVWNTADRCDGTLIAVRRDTVLVTDFVKHISLLVRAGHSYLAKAHR
jgi:hypothetical protein